MMGRIALHAEAARRFFPRPDVRFIPLQGQPVEIAVATRTADHRPGIEVVRHAARMLRLRAEAVNPPDAGPAEHR
jgi:hypothetical protein